MKRTALALTLILTLLLLTLLGMYSSDVATANPYTYHESVSPPADAKPPIISMLSPENKSYSTNNVFLTFNVQVEYTGSAWLNQVRYKASWERDDTSVYQFVFEGTASFRGSIEFSSNLTKIPEGRQNVTVYANYEGQYSKWDDMIGTLYSFARNNSLSVYFTIDTKSPSISVLSLENRIYNSDRMPLDFTINESVSEIMFSLDGQDNVTVAGNTTLLDLYNGDHNVTVYAKDDAGNIGVSETICFTIDVPFPTALVATTSGISLACAGIGLLVYKKRKR